MFCSVQVHDFQTFQCNNRVTIENENHLRHCDNHFITNATILIGERYSWQRATVVYNPIMCNVLKVSMFP